MATIKEIAKACNVSVATVSNILNGKPGASEATKKRVEKAIIDLDYTPNYVAKHLKMKYTRSIGVIAEDMTIFSIPDIIDGITAHCEKEDYQILLTNLRLYKKYEDLYFYQNHYYDFVQQEIRKLMAKQVDGIIYVSAHERLIQCIPEHLSIPAVMAYGYTKSAKVPSVIVDEINGAYQMVQYLIEAGHKRIGLITGKPSSVHVQERLKGYQKALFDNGILYDPDLVQEGDWSRISGYQNTEELLKKNASVIFCMNDLMAGGVYERLLELDKKVADDISVVGYDNRELSSYYNPPLTTVNLPLHDIGYCASEIMIDLLEGRKTLAKEECIYRVKGVNLIRKSVKPFVC